MFVTVPKRWRENVCFRIKLYCNTPVALFLRACGQLAKSHIYAAGLDSLISNLFVACSGWRGQQPVECWPYCVSLTVKEQHLFWTPFPWEQCFWIGGLITPSLILLAEVIWLVPEGGGITRYFRSADVRIIRLVCFKLKACCFLRNRVASWFKKRMSKWISLSFLSNVERRQKKNHESMGKKNVEEWCSCYVSLQL